MTREKQIEEMAKQLYGNFGLTMTTARNVAKYLTEKKGYRKASEVIDEFAERLLKNILEYTIGNDQLAYFLKGYINKTANEMKEAER